MRSVTYFLRSSSLKCSKQTFPVHSAIVNWVELLSFISFPSEANRETKKTFFPVEYFTPFWWRTRRHSEINQSRSQTKQDFSEEACQNKTLRPNQPCFHTARSRQRRSGPPYLHRVYNALNRIAGGCQNLPFYMLVELFHREAGFSLVQTHLLSQKKLKSHQHTTYWRLQGKIMGAWEDYSDSKLTAKQLLQTCSYINGPTHTEQ